MNSGCVLLQKARAYFARTGLTSTPQVLVNGVPLKQVDLNPDDFEETIVRQIMMLTPAIQRDVYHVRKLTSCCVDIVVLRQTWYYIATTIYIHSKCACTCTVSLHYMYVQICVLIAPGSVN